MREPSGFVTLLLILLACFCVYGASDPDGAEKAMQQVWAGLHR